MHSFRFFVPKDQIPTITGSDVHHIKDVLRMQPNDKLTLLDGQDTIYDCKITAIGTDKIDCEIIHKHKEDKKNTVSVTIAQALPQSKKMHLIIQKCTELGVDRIIPVQTERSIGTRSKTDRWKKIAKEAAQQCGRSDVPEILELTKLDDLLDNARGYDIKLIPWELENKESLKSVLQKSNPSNILVVIGPEAGFTRKEIDLATKAGFIPITLGKRILRTETAGLAALSAISYELE